MRGAEERRRRLAGFIRWLEGEGVFRFRLGEFGSRLRVQKYVFIARFFGLDLGYRFSLYVRGPYSPELARDYYDINVRGAEPWVPEGFDREGFLGLVRGRDERWLELAATVLYVGEEVRGVGRLVEVVNEIKPSFSVGEVRRVVAELRPLLASTRQLS